MPPETSEALLQQSHNDSVIGSSNGDSPASPLLLTLKEIAEELGVSYGRLRGFADTTGIQEFVGAVEVRGVKGVRYPESALHLFRGLIDAQDQGLVTPKTAAAWLRNQWTEPATPEHIAASQQSSNGNGMELVPVANALMQQSHNTDMLPPPLAQMVASMQELAHAMRQSAAPETYYSLKAAAEVTGLSQSVIRAGVPYVLDGTRHKYAASDLKAFQDALPRHLPRPRQKRLPAAPVGERVNDEQADSGLLS